MQQLDQIIDFYLKSETNHAMMITGDWGVGKTYYYKNVLENQISETPTYHDNQKKYKPILISLFGLKSIDEIQSEIFLSLYPILRNKAVKLTAGISKSLIKGIMKITNLGDYDSYVSEVDINKGDWINFNDLVICFDDLERVSKALNIEEIIGYINSLVENENVKVLILANETKIDDQNYFVLKEKVVGNSIEFVPDINQSFDSLIEAKFAGSPNYKVFLSENKDSILEVFSKKSSNLRILSFVLTYFQSVYSIIKNELPIKNILKEREGEILTILLRFSIAISIEYKEGTISFKKKEELDIANGIDMPNLKIGDFQFGSSKNEKQQGDKTYREKFIALYYSNYRYHYFRSVYNFLTGGSIFKLEELIQELNMYYHIEDNKVQPQYEILRQLRLTDVLALTDREYKQFTKQMLNYADEGKYDLTTYDSVFGYALQFENPLNFKPDELEVRIIRGMRKGKKSYQYMANLDYYLGEDSSSVYKNHLVRIRKAAIDLNNQLGYENDLAEAIRLEDLCYRDFELFRKEALYQESVYRSAPIFQFFNASKFYSFFLKSKGNVRWEIINTLSYRYRNIFVALKPEINFLEKLKQKVEKKIKTIPKNGPSHYLFDQFSKVLQNSIENLNAAT